MQFTRSTILLLIIATTTAGFAATSGFDLAQDVATRGLLLTLFSVYVGGLLVSLTPCLYPMIPITLSVIGARSAEQKPVHGFIRALSFVLGIAVVYTAIGVITSALGVSIQVLLQYKLFWFMLAVFFGAMGLSMPRCL